MRSRRMQYFASQLFSGCVRIMRRNQVMGKRPIVPKKITRRRPASADSELAQPSCAIQSSASAPAAMRMGVEGSVAARQIASATSGAWVIGPDVS